MKNKLITLLAIGALTLEGCGAKYVERTSEDCLAAPLVAMRKQGTQSCMLLKEPDGGIKVFEDSRDLNPDIDFYLVLTPGKGYEIYEKGDKNWSTMQNHIRQEFNSYIRLTDFFLQDHWDEIMDELMNKIEELKYEK